MGIDHDDRLRDHWYARAGWSPSSRYLTWHLLPARHGAGHDALLGTAAALGEALLEVPGLDVVPADWLHLTVQGVGFRDDVAPADVRRLVAATERRLRHQPPVVLRFDPPEVMAEGVTLSGGPAEPVTALRSCLRAGIAEVRGPDGVHGEDDEPVWPHISLAYAHDAVPAGAVLDALARVAATPVVATFTTASLIELRREGRSYRWDVVAAVPLGAVRPVATRSPGPCPPLRSSGQRPGSTHS